MTGRRSTRPDTLRMALTQALEALELGNAELAVLILLAALEDSYEAPVRLRVRCSHCGQAFEWPGLLDAHFCARAMAA